MTDAEVIPIRPPYEAYRTMAQVQAKFIGELRGAAQDVLTDYGHHCDNHDECDCSMARLARLVNDGGEPDA